MATVLHSTLTGSDSHEPKGAVTAAVSSVYVADGAGSGAWTVQEPKGISTASSGDIYVADGASSGDWIPGVSYCDVSVGTTGTTTGISTVFKTVSVGSLGGSMAWVLNIESDMTFGTTAGSITIDRSGIHRLSAGASIKRQSAAGNAIYELTFGKQSLGVGTVVAQTTKVHSFRSASATTDTGFFAVEYLDSLTATDKMYLMIRETAGVGAPELTFRHVNLNVVRIG